jgi:hypothetical protein
MLLFSGVVAFALAYSHLPTYKVTWFKVEGTGSQHYAGECPQLLGLLNSTSQISQLNAS